METFTCPKCQCLLSVSVAGAATGTPVKAPSKPAARLAQGELGELLEQAAILASGDWEETFVREQRERYAKYGEDTRISEKQMRVLRKILDGVPE